MSKNKKSILFLGKKGDVHCEKALTFVETLFENVDSFFGEWGDKLPQDTKEWEGDLIISYLSRWVIPERLLNKASLASINFHPASPEYPGIGCVNFALYENASSYGATCHHMASSVDTGRIIAVERFPVYESDSVESLLSRTYDFQLSLFYRILNIIYKENELPFSEETWTRKPFTREEFNELGTIYPGITKEELDRRVRATSFGFYQPCISLFGYNFKLSVND